MVFTQFLQKINLKRSLFACLLWSLLASSLEATSKLDEILEEVTEQDFVIYHYDGGYLVSNYTFEKSDNYSKTYGLREKTIDNLLKVCKKVHSVIKNCTLKDIQDNTKGLRFLLAQLFALKDYDKNNLFYQLIDQLDKIEKDNKTGVDAILYERTGKSQSFLYCVLNNGYEQRWEIEKEIMQLNSEHNIDWNEWNQKNADELVTKLNNLSGYIQKIGKQQPIGIEIDDLLQASNMHYTLFDYFLKKGDEQHKNDELYWLNKKYLMYGSNSVTFLYAFFYTFYNEKEKIKIRQETKKTIFGLINENNQLGIDILQQNEQRISEMMSPTAFVEACLHDEEDAILFLKKIKETYKNRKKDAIEYLNSTRENGTKSQDALMAALYIGEKEKPVFKNKLIKKLLEVEGILVTRKHMNYLKENHKGKNQEHDSLHSTMNKIYQSLQVQVIIKEKESEIKKLKKEQQSYNSLQSLLKGKNVSNKLLDTINKNNQKINDLENKLEIATQEKDMFKSQLQETSATKKSLENELKQARENFTNSKQKLESKLKEANKKAEDLDDKLTKSKKELEGKLTEAHEGKRKIEIELTKLKHENNKLGSSKEAVKELSKKIEKLQNQLDEKSKEIAELKNKNSKPGLSSEEISGLKNELNKKSKQINQLSQQVQEFETKIQNSTDSKQTELGNQLEESERKNQRLKEKLKTNQEKSKDLQKKLDTINKNNQKVTQITEEINQLKKNKFSPHFALKVYSGIISLVLIAAGILGVWYRNMMKKQLEEATK